MATCSSPSALSNSFVDNLSHRHLKVSTNYGVTVCISSSFDSLRKASMSLIDHGKPNNYLIYRYFTSSDKGSLECQSCLGPDLKDVHCSCFAIVSTGTACDVSFDNSACEDQHAGPAASSKQKIPADKISKLVSGSCYLPHPDKVDTGGEDAHFICDDEQVVGVADGVGGWADHGVDAGLFAQELMSNSVDAIQQEPKGSVDPARVLEKAHSSIKASGSSTACIIALTDKGLHAINLGDSGFMVVRDGWPIFRSPVQKHSFNFTYQLGSGGRGDLPSSAQVFSIPVALGDVIVAGTDGLFDNLYDHEVAATVYHAVSIGLGPRVAARKIAAFARRHAHNKRRQTPFSAAAQDTGYRYFGGKLDDITVVISYITSSNSEIHIHSDESGSSSGQD